MKRESITTLDELLKYAGNQIQQNVKKSKVNLILLKLHLDHRGQISNSHSAPIHGVTNWGNRHKDRPRNYPGWSGRVWVFFSKVPDTHFSSEFSNSLIYSGTGGGGLYNISGRVRDHIGHPPDLPNNRYDKYTYKGRSIRPYSYDCKVFLDDLPGIQAHYLLLGEKIPQTYEGVYETNIERRIYSRNH